MRHPVHSWTDVLFYILYFLTVYFTIFFIGILVDEAVTIAHDSVFLNMGQNCCAASRTFVHENIYDKFVEKAAKLASRKKVGDQFDPDTQVWPLVRLCTISNALIHVVFIDLHTINITVFVILMPGYNATNSKTSSQHLRFCHDVFLFPPLVNQIFCHFYKNHQITGRTLVVALAATLPLKLEWLTLKLN